MINKSPIFIVGLPRSGTTLTSTLISSSDDICITPEIWYFNYFVPRYSFLDLKHEKDRSTFIDLFLNSKRFGYTGLDTQVMRKKLSAIKNLNHDKLFMAMLDEYAVKEKKKRVGEKTPGQYKYMNDILTRFPTCKMICLVRDPRAIAASLINVPFGTNYVSVTAKRWVRYMKDVEKIKDKSNVLVIQYEQLVQDTEEYIEVLNDFLGINLNPELAKSDRSDSFTVVNRKGWSVNHFKAASSSVNTKSITKWKHSLTNRQIYAIEVISGSFLQLKGYKSFATPEQGISFFVKVERISFKFSNLLKKILNLRSLQGYNKFAYRFNLPLYEAN